MKLLVKLYKDIEAERKPLGIPETWPAEVEEVEDDASDPGDGRLMMTSGEYSSYLETYRLGYDAYREIEEVPLLKSTVSATIDKRTDELILEGFIFSEKTFSLSQNAQSTYTALYSIRDESILSFPIRVNTIDDLDFYDLKSAADIRAFFLAAVGTYRAHIDGGTSLKNQIRLATTSAEINSIQDLR